MIDKNKKRVPSSRSYVTMVYKDHRIVVIGWSLKGIKISADRTIAIPGELGSIISVELEIRMDEVKVLLPVELCLVHNESDTRNYTFVNLGKKEERILRTYMAPKSQPLQKHIPVAGRSASKSPPTKSSKNGGSFWRYLGNAVKILLAVALLGAIGYGGMELPRLLTRNDFSTFAAVAVQARGVSSPERGFVAGDLVAVGQDVSAAQPIFELYRYSDLGAVVEVVSPCDCEILSLAVQRGDEVQAGDSLALVRNSEQDVSLLIEALFPRTVTLTEGANVDVLLEGTDAWLSGRVRSTEDFAESRMHGLPANLKNDPRYRLVYVEIAEANIEPRALAPATIRSQRPEHESIKFLKTIKSEILDR